MSPFLTGVTWLLLFQCAGEAISRLVSLPVPGPVIGMLLLFVALRARDGVPDSVGTAADGLAKHLSLLFVPAGVGVMMYFGRLASAVAADRCGAAGEHGSGDCGLGADLRRAGTATERKAGRPRDGA